MRAISPMSAVVPGVAGEVLTMLARTTQPLTGRQIALLVAASASQSGISRVLRALGSRGIVQRQPAGSAHLYTLNREHLAASAIVELASLRQRLVHRIAEEVARWALPAEAVWLFGSTARSQDGPGSDVDLVVLRAPATDEDDPAWEEQLSRLTEGVRAWTGSPVDLVEHDRVSLAAVVSSCDRFVEELRRDAVTVTGPGSRRILANLEHER